MTNLGLRFLGEKLTYRQSAMNSLMLGAAKIMIRAAVDMPPEVKKSLLGAAAD